MHAPNFETLVGNFKVEKWNFELKLQNNFQIFFETLLSKFCLLSKFAVISWFMKQNIKFVKRRFQGRSKTFFEAPDWSFEVSIQNFIFNFEVSDQSFEIRRARINHFDYKMVHKLHTLAFCQKKIKWEGGKRQ